MGYVSTKGANIPITDITTTGANIEITAQAADGTTLKYTYTKKTSANEYEYQYQNPFTKKTYKIPLTLAAADLSKLKPGAPIKAHILIPYGHILTEGFDTILSN